MDSPLYHSYHHFHDPTIINVHTLLKPQPYNLPSYGKTQFSPCASYTPLYQQPHKTPTSLIHQNDFSNPPPTLTPSYYTSPSPNPYSPPSNYHQQTPTSYSSFPTPSPLPYPYPSYANSFHPHGYGYSVAPMVISVFDGDEEAYWWLLCTEKVFKEQGTPEAMKITKAVAALRARAHQWWLWRSRRQPPITTWEAFTTVFLWRFKPEWREILPVDNEEEEPDLDLSLSNGSSNHVAESATTMEEAVIVDASFTRLPTNTTAIVSIATDEGSRDDVVTMKDLEEGIRQVPPSNSQSSCDSNRVKALTIQSIVDVPIRVVPTKHLSIFPTRPLLLPYRSTVLTSNDCNTLSGETKQQALNHELSVNYFERSFDFSIVCTFNFDPGGTLTCVDNPSTALERRVITTAFVVKLQACFSKFLNPCFMVFDSDGDKHRFSSLAASFGNGVCVFDPGGDEHRFRSPTSIFSNFYSTSPMLVPWDRGKLGVCNWLSPVSNLSHIHNTLSLLWRPLDRGKKSWNSLKIFPASVEFALMKVYRGAITRSIRLTK